MTQPMVILNDQGSRSITQMMDLAMQRQRLIAQNLANVNTPGYIRHDIEFHETLAKLVAAGDDSSAAAAVRPTVVEDTTDKMRDDGNNIIPGREMSEMMQNGVFYNLLSKAFNTRLNILRSAMRSG
ncbi:MAG: flagellar basal-body rod protein FlgB [Lentisphaerae bacterium RIFOXYB12_FULL_65_16]|nr:MAG: flagellar basal-body rod protein FlgB [Lentisphaerae bacterium RIFOXYA12_64_32]OGV88884.1 MAG: flagellar basal-body rod protein FlgB [Lentisphaerae bacterium RIFOXYB12_FULL_65_16]